ncbi:hypothetical protein QUA62_28460 [Microcoleus sp. MON1_C1]|uniref:hypothetical protein n=1 Tax=Microcoleus sp. MON1_C1 TaxID=2818827 RepID=UPI002FD23315
MVLTTNSTRTAEKFYRFTSSMSKKLRQADLSAAEWRFWSYLSVRDPWGDKYVDLDPLDIMAECGMSKSTYYRAKAKFQELGLFDFQESKVSFRTLTDFQEVQEPVLKNETVVSSVTPEFQNDETVVSSVTLELQARDSELQERENQALKPLASKDSGTLQTYSDLLKTLSEETRESFEKFCSKKIEECSFKIASRKAWLNKHGAEYLEEFKERYSEALVNPTAVAPKVESSTFVNIPTLKAWYGDAWQEAAKHHGLIPSNFLVEKNDSTV